MDLTQQRILALTKGWEDQHREDRLHRSESRTLYSSNGHPTLLPSYVAYLDMLGGKSMMMDLNEESLRSLLETLDSVEWILGPTTRSRYLSFSDNVVLGAPLDYDFDHDGGSSWYTKGIAKYQTKLALVGIFVRGGISTGPLYLDDSRAIGRALVEAVLLEEHKADTPRILVTDDVADSLINRGGDSRVDLLLRDKQDGRLFLNYLASVMSERPTKEQVINTLAAHRRRVTDQLQTQTCEKVHRKYRWAAAYHNFFVDSLGIDELVDGADPLDFEWP